MKTIQTIIERRGGLEALKETALRIENGSYMALCIEYIGTGPRGLPLVSVAHYGRQNGDAMRDPDMCFEVVTETALWGWFPISYVNDYLNQHQDAVWKDGARVMHRPKLVKDLARFAKTWDKNLATQGFPAAAERAETVPA